VLVLRSALVEFVRCLSFPKQRYSPEAE